MTVASLPMYDLPEIRDATDAWWSGLAKAFVREGIADVPSSLHREGNYRQAWTRPDLLLSQTCGYPLTHELRECVTLVATPCYAAEGCVGSDYCSAVMVHAESAAQDLSDLRGKRCAASSMTSHSGYNSLRKLMSQLAGGDCFFSNIEISGSHLRSVAMIAAGDADVASIDCVTHALLERHHPEILEGTRVLCLTPRAPGLPYITRSDAGPDLVRRLRHGLSTACADPDLADCREALLITGVEDLSVREYDRIDRMERDAVECGYSELC
jgi:ABC-type phosphate/phosphonate transport system substrate-binding protein